MANDAFNGSVAVFNSATLGSVRGIDYSASGAKCDLTATGDTTKTHDVGIPEIELSIDFVGTPDSLTVGSYGALTITWQDGTTIGSITTAKVQKVSARGSMDGEITGSATFVPSK